jgi:aminoglycoside phosphotransferase (APT) family kinase protein
MPKDVYLQPEAADPILSSETVFAIASKFVPSAKTVTSVDESGGEARTYGIDQDFILKVQRPHRLRPGTNLEKEVFFLTQLATDQRISVPRVLGYGREEPNIEYILMSRMLGQPFRRLKLAGESRTEALRALGQTIALAHQLDQTNFSKSSLFLGDQSFEDFKARLTELFDEAVSLIEKRIAERVLDWQLKISPKQLAKEAITSLPNYEERVALHSNPGPEHTFINPANNTFSGLIDFGDAYISHPALDLRRWPFPRDRAALLEGYVSLSPVSENFLKTWQLVMILADLTVLANSSIAALIQAVQADLQTK